MISNVRQKYEALAPLLHEKARRCWAASEALSLGRGGITLVAAATNLSRPMIRRGIAEIFAKCDVETIAPGYGCILQGRNVVARHVAMLDETLKGLDKSVAVSRYVGRDEER